LDCAISSSFVHAPARTLARLCALLAIGGALIGGPAARAEAAASAPSPVAQQVQRMRDDLTTERQVRERQGEDASYYFSSVAIVIAVMTVLVGVVAIVVTVVGYRFVRWYIAEEFSRSAAEAFENDGRVVLEAKFEELRQDYDTQLDELFNRFRRATEGEQP
jgi:hypothetical protein